MRYQRDRCDRFPKGDAKNKNFAHPKTPKSRCKPCHYQPFLQEQQNAAKHLQNEPNNAAGHQPLTDVERVEFMVQSVRVLLHRVRSIGITSMASARRQRVWRILLLVNI